MNVDKSPAQLKAQLTHWRSVALGLFLGFILVNAMWVYFCLRHISESQ